MNNSDERDFLEERWQRGELEREGREELAVEQLEERTAAMCPSYLARTAHQAHPGCVGITLAEAYPALDEDEIAPNAGSAS